MGREPYYEALKLLEANPYLEARGRVYSCNSHYVHERSTKAEINLEGWMGATEDAQTDPTDKVYAVVIRLEEALGEQVVAWNRELTRALYVPGRHAGATRRSGASMRTARGWTWPPTLSATLNITPGALPTHAFRALASVFRSPASIQINGSGRRNDQDQPAQRATRPPLAKSRIASGCHPAAL